jgi:hypothetical protein
MSKELWATYSVKDHLEPRALAADILLFDRLVFPVPESPRFPENSAPPDRPGEIEWTPDPAEWARWKEKDNNWDPDAQHRLLELLKPVIRKVSWDDRREKQWHKDAADLAAEGVPDYAFVATRTALTRDLPAHVEGVAALGPMYRTVGDAERELRIRDTSVPTQLPGGALAAVLGWEFLTPEDNRLSDEALLKETVDFVTGDDEFRRCRRNFLDWQQDFLKDGTTDRESIAQAVKDMRELLNGAKKAARRLKIRKTVRYAFRIAPPAVGLTLAIAGIPGGFKAAAGGGFLSFGGILVEEWLFKGAEQGQPARAAFAQHVNRHFGWK